jgi:hypothetical protein
LTSEMFWQMKKGGKLLVQIRGGSGLIFSGLGWDQAFLGLINILTKPGLIWARALQHKWNSRSYLVKSPSKSPTFGLGLRPDPPLVLIFALSILCSEALLKDCEIFCCVVRKSFFVLLLNSVYL